MKRIREWDNGNYNIREFSLAEWLENHKKIKEISVKMHKKSNLIVMAIFYLGLNVTSVVCQTPIAPEIKIPASPQSSSNGQTVKNHFSSELLNYFKGDWNGAGKFTASGKDVFSDLSFVADAYNQTLIVREKERAPNTYHFIALWSIDTANGNLVMLFANDSGAELFRSESGGWQNDKIIFQSTPELKAVFAFERFIFERKSNDSFVATYEMSRDGKTWRTGDTQTFTRK